jgi:hypothetical protein
VFNHKAYGTYNYQYVLKANYKCASHTDVSVNDGPHYDGDPIRL